MGMKIGGVAMCAHITKKTASVAIPISVFMTENGAAPPIAPVAVEGKKATYLFMNQVHKVGKRKTWLVKVGERR